MPVDRLSPFAHAIYKQKYSMGGTEEWADTARRVAVNVMAAVGFKPNSHETTEIERLIRERKFLPGGRYLYASGRDLHQVQNCLLLRADDSREGWGDLWQKAGMALMTGAGIGVDYSRIRPKDSPVRRTGGLASGPVSLMKSVNEIGRQVMQGGSHRSAIWAGLRWDHRDIHDFIRCKDWPEWLREQKERDFTVEAPMELTNVSVILDDRFFEAYHNEWHPEHDLAHEVYWKTVEKMVVTAEPGFSVDTGANAGESLRNACTEVTSRDDSDICNLGSINLARIDGVKEMKEAVELASLFLIAGTVYSHVPYSKVGKVREQNRRLGLGVMGVHEWLLRHGKPYGPDKQLGRLMEAYAASTDVAARHADALSLSRPVKTRAVAPTGTIGIIGETTTGIEPIFCKAYKRRYLSGGSWMYQYVIDPTARRVVEETGVKPDEIEDAYALSLDVERRVNFQSWVQKYVDHGISSTINLPHPITDRDEVSSFGRMLLKHLPNLRGVTCYPDGARGGQPLEVASYEYAAKQEGVVFEETEDRCVGGVCGV